MEYCSCFAQRSLTPTVLHDKILNNSRHLSFTSSQGFPLCHRRAHKRRELGWAESFQNSKGARRLNSRHFTTPKLVSRQWRLRNERRTSILMTHLLIGWSKFPTRHNHDASSVWNFCARFSDVISRGNQWVASLCRSDWHWFDISFC